MFFENLEELQAATEPVWEADVLAPPRLAREELRVSLELAPVDRSLLISGEFFGEPAVGRCRDRIARSKRPIGFGLSAVLRGHARITVDGRDFPLEAGDLCLLSGALPFTKRLSPSYKEILYLTPLEALGPDLIGPIERAPRVVNARSGFARVLALQLSTLAVHSPGDDPVVASRLNSVTQHLVGAVFGAADASTTAELRNLSLREAHRQRVLAVIARDFADPELDPEGIAGRCRISVRYLHALFAGEDTVSSRIMAYRLEHSYARLVRGAASGPRPVIGEVARASGFKSLPHFCRSFKKRFGITPNEARRR